MKSAKEHSIVVPSVAASSVGYGTPPRGSLTALRGKLAHKKIGAEVIELCSVISNLGGIVCFRQVFRIYETKNNKVVGLLLRAKRHHLVDFEKEMLYQGQDDNVVINLLGGNFKRTTYNSGPCRRDQTESVITQGVYDEETTRKELDMETQSFEWGDALSCFS